MTARTTAAAHLPAALAGSAAVLVAAAVVGGLVAGATGAVGAAAGVGLVAAGNAFSTLAVARADAVARSQIMVLGLMAYVVKITAVGAVMWLAAIAGWRGLTPMAWGIVAGVLGWVGVTVWRHVRRAEPTRPDVHRP